MTLAREISLHTIHGRPRLIQRATGDFAALPETGPAFSLTDTEIAEGTRILEDAAGSVQRIDITLTPGTAAEFGLVVRGDGARGTRIGIRPAEGTLIVDRRDSGATGFHESFPSIDSAPVLATEGSYDLTVYVDRCSVEVFAQGGQVTMTELIFPADTSTDVAVYATGGTATINRLEITQFG
jgi:levanase/fructan beta-fructosidase